MTCVVNNFCYYHWKTVVFETMNIPEQVQMQTLSFDFYLNG